MRMDIILASQFRLSRGVCVPILPIRIVV